MISYSAANSGDSTYGEEFTNDHPRYENRVKTPVLIDYASTVMNNSHIIFLNESRQTTHRLATSVANH